MIPLYELIFSINSMGSAHNTAFDTPVVEHWLEGKIAVKDRPDNPYQQLLERFGKNSKHSSIVNIHDPIT